MNEQISISDLYNENDNITGERIKKLRKKMHMTQEELGSILGIKKAAVQKYEKGTVKNIKRATLIKLAEHLGTTVEYLLGIETPRNAVSVNSHDLVSIPVLASVAAGIGAFADSTNNVAIGYEPVLKSSLSIDADYVYLRVTGDSMYPMFMEGDLVLVRCQNSIDSGSYGVVMIDNDTGVVKRVIYGNNFIELQSMNPMYPPRRFEGEDMNRLRIFGLVKEIKRKF